MNNIKKQTLYVVNIILAASCLVLLALLVQRWYCNRLELVAIVENEVYTIQQYIDWSKSKYCCKDKDPWLRNQYHYMVITCNNKVLINFFESDGYGENIPHIDSYICAIQNDTLILKRTSRSRKKEFPYDVFIYIPLQIGKITNIKDVKIKAYRYLIGRDGQPFNSNSSTPMDSLYYQMHLW